MPAERPQSTILAMTRIAPSRLHLVADTRSAPQTATPGIRRYRLARLRPMGLAAAESDRFAHLKRTYD